MKINFVTSNNFSSFSFKSLLDFDESAFEYLGITDKFSPNEKDMFVPSKMPVKRKKEQNVSKTGQEFSLQRTVNNFLSLRKDIKDTKEVNLVAKAAYLYALRMFPENCGERNSKISGYISKRLEEKFPQQKLIADEPMIKDDKKQAEELKEHILRCRMLNELYGNTLNPKHQNFLLQYCENQGNCLQIAREMGRTKQHVKVSIERIVKKLEDLDEQKKAEKPFENRILDFIKNTLQGEVTCYNHGQMLEKFASAFVALTPVQKQFVFSRYLGGVSEQIAEASNDIPEKFHPDTNAQTIAKLRKKMGIKKKFSAQEIFEIVEKYSEKFSDTEKIFLKTRYKDPDNPTNIKQMVDILNLPYKRLCSITQNISCKLKRISANSTKAEGQLEKNKIVSEFFASRSHLLSPVQKEMIEIMHFSGSRKSLQQTSKIMGMPFATLQSYYNNALEILKGKISRSKELIKKETETNLIKLFEEKKFFFSKRQQNLFSQIFINRSKSQKEVAEQNKLSEDSIKKFKKNIIQVLQDVSVEDYLEARAKLKQDVESALNQNKLKNDKKMELLQRYILSDSPEDLDDIGYELNIYHPRSLLKQTFIELDIKTDIPNFIL